MKVLVLLSMVILGCNGHFLRGTMEKNSTSLIVSKEISCVGGFFYYTGCRDPSTPIVSNP